MSKVFKDNNDSDINLFRSNHQHEEQQPVQQRQDQVIKESKNDVNVAPATAHQAQGQNGTLVWYNMVLIG